MKNNKIIWLLCTSAVALMAVVGFTYAWFTQNSAMATLMEILPPDTITIVPVTGANGTDLVELDLDYKEGVDKKDPDGTIYILRPICIRSTIPNHRLEIVHTTNLSSLSFKIYPATVGKDAQGQDTLIKGDALTGEYKNQQGSLASPQNLENYKSDDEVESHAYPLYWLATTCSSNPPENSGWRQVTSYTVRDFDPNTKQETDFYWTYYYLEIIWKAETKETDLFYIMAQNVAQSMAE